MGSRAAIRAGRFQTPAAGSCAAESGQARAASGRAEISCARARAKPAAAFGVRHPGRSAWSGAPGAMCGYRRMALASVLASTSWPPIQAAQRVMMEPAVSANDGAVTDAVPGRSRRRSSGRRFFRQAGREREQSGQGRLPPAPAMEGSCARPNSHAADPGEAETRDRIGRSAHSGHRTRKARADTRRRSNADRSSGYSTHIPTTDRCRRSERRRSISPRNGLHGPDCWR